MSINHQPTTAEKDEVIRWYHKLPYKEICLPLLKKIREEVPLDYLDIKTILENYIERTYKN